MLLLHLVMALLKALLDALKRLSDGSLVLILQRHLLHITAQFHKVSMSFDVSLLLLLVAVDPDLTSVFLGCDELSLLVDLVKQLLLLDVVLLLKRLLFDFERISLALNLSQLLLLLIILPLVGLEHLVTLCVGFAHLLELLVQLVEIILSLLTHFIRLLEMRVCVFEVVFEAQVVLAHALVLNLERGVVARKFVQLCLQLVDLHAQSRNSLISVLLDFIDAYDLALEGLSFFEERFVHLLHLLTLDLVLLFQRLVLLQSQLQVGFLACKTIDESFLRLLDQDKLAHLLLLVLDRQILVLDDLLCLEQLLLHCLVGTNLLLTLNNQRLDALFLVVDL